MALVNLGQEFTPDDVDSYRTQARFGDPRRLYAMWDEWLRLGPTAPYRKAVEWMKAARPQFITFPEDYDDDANVPEGADPREVAEARAARDFLEDTLSERLSEIIEIHADQEFYGIADSRWRIAPRANAGRWEAIDSIEPIPPRRHKLDTSTHEWVLTPSPYSDQGVPISSLTLRPDAGLEGLFFTEIGAGAKHLDQRGLFFEVMVPWQMHQYVVRWRAKHLELYGSPMRFGIADPSVPGQHDEMMQMLGYMGHSGFGVFDKARNDGVTDVKLLDAASSGANDPYEMFLEWINRQYAEAILWHTQASSVQKGAGSRTSADVAVMQAQEATNARLIRIASQLRRGPAKILIARNLGARIAERHTPIVRLLFVQKDDPVTLAEIAAKLYSAGAGPSIGREDLVRRCSLRVVVGDEQALPALPVPQPSLPTSLFGAPAEARPARALSGEMGSLIWGGGGRR